MKKRINEIIVGLLSKHFIKRFPEAYEDMYDKRIEKHKKMLKDLIDDASNKGVDMVIEANYTSYPDHMKIFSIKPPKGTPKLHVVEKKND